MSTDPNENKQRKKALPQTDVPSYPLSEALRVPQAIVDHLAKAPGTPLQVAAAMGIKPTTGLFRTLTGTAVAYGLTDGAAYASKIELTDLGRRIVAPLEEGMDVAARREAVLRPRVTRAFLERYNGSKWPKSDIAANVVETLGVPVDQAARAVARIREDALEVGFITEINGDEFVSLDVPEPEGGEPVGNHGAPTGETVPEEVGDTPAAVIAGAPIAAKPSTTVNRRVFITHGKDTAIVRQIKEILSFGDFVPVVAAEIQTAAKPVPDKVMDEMRSCGAGIVHVGTELRLLDADGTEHQVLNPNVLIEIGAAMALYGRNFILLVKRGTTLPSNLQGLYEVRYDGDALDHEATMNLLKAFNSFKDGASPVEAAA